MNLNMTLRYSSGRSSSDLFQSSFSEGANILPILDNIAAKSDIESVPLTESVYDTNPTRNKRQNNTNIKDLTDDASDSDSDSDSDPDENEYDDDNIGEVFEEIRQTFEKQLSENVSAYLEPVSKKIDIQDIEESIDRLPKETHIEEKSKSCANCCKPRRVENVSWLKEGQHIRISGNHLTFNCRRKLVSFYHHHAIVKRVYQTFKNSIELVLIHFSKVDKKVKITEETRTYNLENDEIDIIDYQHPRYDPETIVQRAESMVPIESGADGNKQFRSYNVLCRNCEHFASWCVVGEGECFQAKGILKSTAKFFIKAAGTGCKIWRFFKWFLCRASHKFAAGIDIGMCLPGICLSANVAIYLIYTVAITIAYRIKLSKGKLCKVCFKREVITLWTNFLASCVISGSSYLIVHFLLPIISPALLVIPLLPVLVMLSLFLQWGIGKLVKALMSPYACDKIEVKKLSQITPGSMISFNYFKIPHYAIVTEKHVEYDESEIGIIKYVHYGLKDYNLFGSREVMEESFELNTTKENTKKVKIIECRQLNTFPPDMVVKRARERIGEKTWNLFSNRSDHLCFDTIEQEYKGQANHNIQSNKIGESNSKHRSSFYIGKKEIHLRNDLQIGHIVKFKTRSEIGAANGIVVWLEDIDECSEQSFKMDLIVYRNYWVIRKTYSVDLKRERLFIKKYHPAHCCTFDKRVNRALQQERTKGEFWSQNSFLRSCILK